MNSENKKFRLPAKKSWLKRYIKGNEAHSSQRKLKERISHYMNDDNIRLNTSQKRRILQNLVDDVHQPSTSQKGHILRYSNGKARINTEQKKSHVLQMDYLTPNSNEVESYTSTEKTCILQRYVTDGNENQSISTQPKFECSTSSQDEEDKEPELMEEGEEEFKLMDVPRLLSPLPPSPRPWQQSEEDREPEFMEEDEQEFEFMYVPRLLSPLPLSPKPCDNQQDEENEVLVITEAGEELEITEEDEELEITEEDEELEISEEDEELDITEEDEELEITEEDEELEITDEDEELEITEEDEELEITEEDEELEITGEDEELEFTEDDEELEITEEDEELEISEEDELDITEEDEELEITEEDEELEITEEDEELEITEEDEELEITEEDEELEITEKDEELEITEEDEELEISEEDEELEITEEDEELEITEEDEELKITEEDEEFEITEEDEELEITEEDEELEITEEDEELEITEEDEELEITEEDEELEIMEEDKEISHLSSPLPTSPKPCDNFLSSSEPVPFKSVPQFEAPSSSYSSSAKFLTESSHLKQKPMLKPPSLKVSIDRCKLPFLSELVPKSMSVKSSQEDQLSQIKFQYPFEQTKRTSQSLHKVISSVSSSGQQQITEEDEELEITEEDEEREIMEEDEELEITEEDEELEITEEDKELEITEEDEELEIMEEDEELEIMEENKEISHLSSPLPASPKPCDNFLSSSEPVPFKSVPQFEAPSSSYSSSAKFLMKSSHLEQKPMLKPPSLKVSIDRSKLPFLSELIPKSTSVKSSQEVQLSPIKSIYPFEQTKGTSQSSHQITSSVSSSGQQQLVKSPMSCQQPTVAPPTRSLQPFVVSSVSPPSLVKTPLATSSVSPPPLVEAPLATSSEPSLVQGEVENTSFTDDWLQFSQELKWSLLYRMNLSSTTPQQPLSSSASGSTKTINKPEQNENLYVFPTKKILNDKTEEYVTFCYNWKKNFEPYVLIGHTSKFLPVPMSTFREILAALTDIENGYSDDHYKDDENELHVMYLKNFPGYITISYNYEVIVLHENTCKKIVELSQDFNFLHNKYIICAVAAILCIGRD